MKLTKSKLIKLVKPNLEELGFKEFKDTKTGAQGLFCKKINNDFYLTLALTIHRYCNNAFVGEFTFSKCTIPYLAWGDIPKEMNVRLGFLLTDIERSIYPNDNINLKGSRDIWWDSNDKNSILDFLRVVQLTEPRITSQPELLKKIEESKDLNTIFTNSHEVKTIVANKLLDNHSFLNVKNKLDGIDGLWFEASEKILTKNNQKTNAHTIIQLATDAYRQYQLDIS